VGQFEINHPSGAKARLFLGRCGTTSQLAEKVISRPLSKNSIALECPRSDPRGAGEGFLSTNLRSFDPHFDFFSKL
jgi:hypothetical protein